MVSTTSPCGHGGGTPKTGGCAVRNRSRAATLISMGRHTYTSSGRLKGMRVSIFSMFRVAVSTRRSGMPASASGCTRKPVPLAYLSFFSKVCRSGKLEVRQGAEIGRTASSRSSPVWPLSAYKKGVRQRVALTVASSLPCPHSSVASASFPFLSSFPCPYPLPPYHDHTNSAQSEV